MLIVQTIPPSDRLDHLHRTPRRPLKARTAHNTAQLAFHAAYDTAELSEVLIECL